MDEVRARCRVRARFHITGPTRARQGLFCGETPLGRCESVRVRVRLVEFSYYRAYGSGADPGFGSQPAGDTHWFNGPLSGTTRVSRYQKGKTNLDFTEATDSEWQWNPLSAPRSRLITMPAPHCSVFTGRMPFLPPNQQRQSTEGKASACR